MDDQQMQGDVSDATREQNNTPSLNEPDTTIKNPAQNGMEDLRNEALEALVPLVDQIEDTPQKKFEILITAARTSDEPRLLRKALDVAMQIENATEKAEALLDIINETSFQEIE